MAADGTHDWYKIVSFGSYGPTGPPPEGIARGREATQDVLGRWHRRMGEHAGSAMAAMSVRVVGPFCSRSAAERATISNHHRLLCTHEAELAPVSAREARRLAERY